MSVADVRNDPNARRVVDTFAGKTRLRKSRNGGIFLPTSEVLPKRPMRWARSETTLLEALTEPFKDDNVARVRGRCTGPGDIAGEVDANEAGRSYSFGRLTVACALEPRAFAAVVHRVA